MIKLDEKIVKYSINIEGRRTSISLEPSFWASAHFVAAEEKIPFGTLCAQIDERRSEGNLSSAIRVYVVDCFRRRS
jgi:predicted DNA-binding ribbon-helix-helix protein